MRHVTVMSLSSSLGIMAIYVVDLCDIFFISLLGEKQMAAAAGFASTIMFFVSAVSIGVSIATGTLVAAALGAGEEMRSREVAATAAVVAIIIGATLPFGVLFFVDELLSFIGATGDVAEMARSYLWIVLPSSFLSGLSMVAVAAVRANGLAKWSMYPALCGAAVNLGLDPVFIFALGFELEGAAMATVAARVATLAVALYAAQYQRKLFVRPNAKIFARHIWPILRYTAPAVFSSLAAPVGMAIVMRYMSKFGPEAVAGMAVIGRMYPVVFSVVNALSGSMGPIIGQNFGAGRIDRVMAAFVAALKFLSVYVAVIGIALLLLREIIADAFGLAGLSRELLYLGCGPLAIIAFFNGAIYISNAVFTNTGRPRYPVWVSWGRSTLGIMPFAHVGSLIWGAKGVLVGVTAGGAVFAAIAVFLGLRAIGKSAERRVEAVQTENMTTPQELIHHSDPWDG